MVYESGVITQHISSVVIFIAIFIYLQLHSLSGTHLIWTGSLLTGVGYIFWDLIMLKTRSNYAFKRKLYARALYFIIVLTMILIRSKDCQEFLLFFYHFAGLVTYFKDIDKSNK